jgi:hypothetical protein
MPNERVDENYNSAEHEAGSDEDEQPKGNGMVPD